MTELTLIKQIQTCKVCIGELPFQPKPILQAHPEAKLLIVGQAPGIKAHQTGIPWNDASGDRLRAWLNLSKDTFYNSKLIAILPMSFCFPGKGKTGDLPPRKICFSLWHQQLLAFMPKLKLTLLIGKYAQQGYLQQTNQNKLIDNVRHWWNFLPIYLPMPHPSPLNNRWLHKNPWFIERELPAIRRIVAKIL